MRLNLLKIPSLKISTSIFDNDRLIIRTPLATLQEFTLADGYHYLQFIIDNSDTSLSHQDIEICTGSLSLHVTVVDELLRPIANITVRMELVGYSHISSELNSNTTGQVLFSYVPKLHPIFIEVVSIETEHHAYAKISTAQNRKITLILQKIPTWHYTEYDENDFGYYAI